MIFWPLTAPMGSIASRVPPTNPAALPPPASAPAPAGLAEALGDGIGEPVTIGLAYALGLAYSVSDSPYLGDDSSGFAYPYLTSFRHMAFTDDWLILTGGELGFRWVNDQGWILGAVGRINTMSSGTATIEELLGFEMTWGKLERIGLTAPNK